MFVGGKPIEKWKVKARALAKPVSLPSRADCAVSWVPPDFFSVTIYTQVFHLYFVKLKKYNKGVTSF